MVGIIRTLVVGAGAVFGSALFYQAHHSLSTTSQHIPRAHTTFAAEDSLDRVLAADSAPDGPLGVASVLDTITTVCQDNLVIAQVDSLELGDISLSLVMDYLLEWWSVMRLALAPTLSSLLEQVEKHATLQSVDTVKEALILYFGVVCCYILTLVAGMLRGISQDAQQHRPRRRRRPAKKRRTTEPPDEAPEDADDDAEDSDTNVPVLDSVKVLQKRLAAAQRSATEQMRRNKPSRTREVKAEEGQVNTAKATITSSASSTAVAVTPPKAVTPHTVMTPLDEASALILTKAVNPPLSSSNKTAGQSPSNKAAGSSRDLSEVPTTTPASIPSSVSTGKAANIADVKVVKSFRSPGRYGIPPESHESQASPARSPSKPPVVLPYEEDVVMEDAEDDKPATSRWSRIPTSTDRPQDRSPSRPGPSTRPAAEANASAPNPDAPLRSRFFSTWSRPEEGPSNAKPVAPSAVTEEFDGVPDVYKAYAKQMEEREEEIRAEMDVQEDYLRSCHDNSMASFNGGGSQACDEELPTPELLVPDPIFQQGLDALYEAEYLRSKSYKRIRILHWRMGLEVAREGLMSNDMLDWCAAEIEPRPTEAEDHMNFQAHTRRCLGERRFETQWGHPHFYEENRWSNCYPMGDAFDIKPRHPGRHLQVLQRAADNLGKIVGDWLHHETTPRVSDATASDFMPVGVQEEVNRLLIMARGLGFDVELNSSPQTITIDVCPNRHFIHLEHQARFGPMPQVVTRVATIPVPHSVKVINAD